MAFIQIRKIIAELGSRQPGDDAKEIGAWIKKELWMFLRRTEKVVNWAVDYLGLVQVDETDEPGNLEDKIVKRELATRTASRTPAGLPVELPGHGPEFEAITRGAEKASQEEIDHNPRSASVRVRCVRRIDGRTP